MNLVKPTHCPSCKALVNTAWRCCAACGVRLENVAEAKPDWLAAWRELAQLTSGLTREDPRYRLVWCGLDLADNFFMAGDWAGFQRAVHEIRGVMNGGPHA